jgi:quinol monooxygenase YgiN
MYVRVTRGRFDPTKYDEVQRLAEEQLLPTIKQRPGFRSYQGGLNRDAGTFVAISGWDTQAQAQDIGAVRAPFEALGVRFEAPEVFEVTVQA